MKFGSILVRTPNWVGDAVMSVPALQALRRAHPSSQISILARSWVADLYGRESFCDELIPYDAPKGWSGLGQKWALAHRLRQRRFDCVLLLQNAFEAAAVARLACIPVRIGYNRDARGWLLTKAVATPEKGDTPPHQSFYYLELLRRAGLIESFSHDSIIIRLEGAAAAAAEGRTFFHSHGIAKPVVAVAPGAAFGGAKRWLPDRFAAAAARLAQEHNAAVAIFGSLAEADICQAVASAAASLGAEAHTFAGTTTLAGLIGCLAASRVLLTNDSGSMHIGSALGTPTVAVFGATDHVATGPTGPLARVVRVPVECSPCLLRECPIDHRCMTAVSSDMVTVEALRLTAATAHAGDR